MEAVEEKAEPVVDKKPEWDKERQRADQAEANLRKTQARQQETELRAQQLEKTVADLNNKMSQIESVKGLNLADLDADKADIPEVVKEYAKMRTALESQTKEIEALKQKAVRYETDAERQRQERDKEATIERILTPLDKKYGAKFRNEARRLAEKEVEARGYAPQDALEAREMLEGYYVNLKAEAEKTKETIPSDNGRGGSKVSFGDNITPGKLDDVMGQIRKGGLAALKKEQ
jgi:chromosome segregation ATPase